MSLRTLLTTLVALAPALSSAKSTPATLFATHYTTGKIHTLQLTQNSSSNYTLTETSALKTCGTYPSWITLDSESRIIYCSDEDGYKNENETVNGSLTALSVGDDGTLEELAHTPNAPGSGVHNVVYEAGGDKFLAVAHYSGAAVSTWSLPLEENADPNQVFNFNLTAPPTVPDRQDASHPHQTFLDPTGSFVIVPDLGADLLRVFAINKDSGDLSTCPSFNYTLGGGPRHGVFFADSQAQRMRIRGHAPGETYLYVTGELNNEVEAFKVEYTRNGCLHFEQIEAVVPYPDEDIPEGASLAEIRLVGSEDMYVSVRLDAAFDGDDSIARLSRTELGEVEFQEITTSGGVLPRTLAINKAGDFVAVGNQLSSNVAIVTRDPETGMLGDVVADLLVGVPGEPDTLEGLSSIIWDE
ncbi:Lactonase, 7-bladed beta-propeller-domain-containing protein [Aspergillus unguis]